MNERKKMNRLAFILAIILAFGVPVSVYADEEEPRIPTSEEVSQIPMDQLPQLPVAAEIPYEGEATDGPVYIYLVRHGETYSNVDNRTVSGLGSAPLTPDGKAVAAYLGMGLSDTYFKSIYSSTLSRTYETAKIILNENLTMSRDMKINQVDDLREAIFGVHEGDTYGDWMRAGVPIAILKETFDHISVIDDQSENYARFLDRVWGALNDICQAETKNGGGNVLIVAHGNVNAVISRNISYENARGTLDNASVVLLKYDKGSIELVEYNNLEFIEKGKAMATAPKPVELNLVVTGETFYEANGRITNIIDGKLTENGAVQINSIAKSFAGTDIRGVYTSDLWKEVETAELIIAGNKNPHLTVTMKESLRGVSTGIFEAAPVEKLPIPSSENPTARERINAYYSEDTSGYAEHFDDAEARIVAEYTKIAKEVYAKGGGSAIIVAPELTHQLAAEALTNALLPRPLVPGDCIQLVYDGENFKTIITLN